MERVESAKTAEAVVEDMSREDLLSLVLAQRAVIADLQKRIVELEDQLGLGDPNRPSASGRSAKPKSSPNKRKPRANSFSRRREAPTHVVDHVPDFCPDCGRALSGGGPGRSRQIIDIAPSPATITEHTLHDRWCSVCKKRVRAQADFSGLAHGRRRIGHNLAAWIANLNIRARVPLRTIQSLIAQMHSVHISLGEMTDLLSLIAQRGEAALEAIKKEVRSADWLHADETGWRENGEYRCLWSLSTRESRWLHIDERRTAEVAAKLIGPDFSGTLVTDFYAAYNAIPGRHQRCWPHFQRALEKLRLHPLADESVGGWIDAVLCVWRKGREYRAFCLSGPIFGAGVFERRRRRRELEEELFGLAEPFLEVDSSVAPQVTLARRVGLFLSELFTFVEFPEVPDDNNAAERSVRPAVIIRKVCGGTRSAKGTSTKAALMSLFGTWQVQGSDPIQECKAILTG